MGADEIKERFKSAGVVEEGMRSKAFSIADLTASGIFAVVTKTSARLPSFNAIDLLIRLKWMI